MDITQEINDILLELDTLDLLEEEKIISEIEELEVKLDKIILLKRGDKCWCGCHAELSLKNKQFRFAILGNVKKNKTLMNSEEYKNYLTSLKKIVDFYSEGF